MNRTPLCDLADKYGTNKGVLGYTKWYWNILRPDRRPPPRRILELGSGAPGLSGGPSEHGASLYMWQEFFPEAEIFAIDVVLELLINGGSIRSYWGDVSEPSTLVDVAETVGGLFDLVVDDAVHDPNPQRSNYETLAPFVAPGGVYVIEDICPGKFPHGDIEWLGRSQSSAPRLIEVYGEGDQTLMALYPR